MKKFIVIIVLGLASTVTFAQYGKQQLLKYVTHFPDGSVAVTILDDTGGKDIEVKSANAFYRYEILDKKTSEPVHRSKNKGKVCIVDKNTIVDGTYDLKLYTSEFVITTDLEILKLGEFYAMLKQSEALVKNE